VTGVIRRTLASRERLLKSFQNHTPGKSYHPPGVENEEGDQSMDQRRMEVREPVQRDITPADLLEQEGLGDWREVVIHFGKKKGAQLGKVGAKSLVWWITEWHPEQFKGKWDEKDILLDAALCLAHAEMSAAEKGAE
jgi:hypothetical protein